MEKEDGVQKLMQIFDDVQTAVITDMDILQELVNCLSHKSKFRIQINGFGGNLANINVQVKTGKRTWVHASKNNSQPTGRK